MDLSIKSYTYRYLFKDLLRIGPQVTNEATSGGSTSSGLGSISSPLTSTPHHVDDDDADVDGGLQTRQLVSACNSAVRRLSSPLTSDSDPIELDRLAWQDHQDVHDHDTVQQTSSARR